MRLSTLLALTCAAALSACTDGPDKPPTTSSGSGDDGNDDGNDDDGGDSGFWAVGENGTMLRLTPAGELSHYPLDSLDIDGDLRAIACKGADQAVVAGAGGIILTTFDAGQTWDRVEVGPLELRAVALSAGPVGYIVGDGVVLRSEDDSRSWTALALAAHDWSAATTTATGATALLTSAAGEIFRLQDTTLERVYTGDGGLLAGIAVTPDGLHAVAVGQAGLVLRSSDGGARWTPEAPATSRDLHAVRIAADASLVVAVGQAGTVLRLGADDSAVTRLLDPALSLRALHLSRTHGHAVGDAGTLFTTHDAGRSWESVALDLEHDLLGLDDLHGEPHL